MRKVRITESQLRGLVRKMIKENSAPEKYVYATDNSGKIDLKKMVGTHQYGKGFTPNQLGIKMGFKPNPTSIPDRTKMDDSNMQGSSMQKMRSSSMQKISESQLKGIVKRMIKEATVDDLFPMDDDIRKLVFTKDMETMGDEKIQKLLEYVNEYENSCIEKLQSAISLNKEQRKIVIRNLFNEMDGVLQENDPMQDRRTYDKEKSAISRVLKGITDGLEYLFKITSTLSEDKFSTFYDTPTFYDYKDYSLSNFINLYNQRINRNIKLFIDGFNSNNIISKNKNVQDLVKECIKDYELNFYEKFSEKNAGEKFMQDFPARIIQKRPNLRERIGMGNTTITESQLRGLVKKMIKEATDPYNGKLF